MIVAIVTSFAVPSAYHLALLYVSAATMFFLVSFPLLFDEFGNLNFAN